MNQVVEMLLVWAENEVGFSVLCLDRQDWMMAIFKILHGNFVHDLTKLLPSRLGDLRPGDLALLGVINTAVTRGENKVHSRGGGGPVRNDTSPKKQKR